MNMKMSKYEKLGLDVSTLGFGCMRLPLMPDGKIDQEETANMIDKAMKSGVTYYDTAYPYHGGESELVVGKILNNYDRSSYYLATKLPVWLVEKTEDVRRYAEEQLKKLDKDYIDFYLLHALNKERFDKIQELKIYEECVKLREEGKIRHIGFSFHDDYEVFEEIINAHDWDFCQIQYNYMDTNIQAGDKGYKLAEEKGIPMVIMEPIRGGSLAKFSDEIEDMFKAVRPDASVASWALRWVASHPNCKVVLSGMSTPEQVEDNLKTFTDFEPLNKEEEETVNKVVATLNARVQNKCTGCRYCMPCPNGVSIPEVFKAWNTYHIYQKYGVVKGDWENNIAEDQKPSQCVECGLCEEQCPQQLNIREDLKRAQQDLDNPKWV